MSEHEPRNYVCINCSYRHANLLKKYSNTVKAINCEQCQLVADKYIEFEPVIIIVDFMLLSRSSYRHALYNQDFKLYWKLSLMLLLLESLTLWRHKNEEQLNSDFKRMPHEHGFYYCCALKIGEFVLCTMLLITVTTLVFRSTLTLKTVKEYSYQLLKANVLANFSKFFLLPIMLWRENTTDFGAALHRSFVTVHHLCALVFVYMAVVSRCRALQAALIVLPIHVLKEIIMQYWYTAL